MKGNKRMFTILCFLIGLFFLLYSVIIFLMKVAFKIVDFTIYLIVSSVYISIFFMFVCCCGCFWGNL